MTYPNRAGYTNKTTSKEAADKINMQYPRQKFAVEDVFKHGDKLFYSADEVAKITKMNLISVRARVCELVKQKILFDSFHKTKNDNNRNVICWIHKDKTIFIKEMFK